MNTKKVWVLLSGMLILRLLTYEGSSQAREWFIDGPRALGMGGAGVAVSNDADAAYWNPAAFGFFKNPEAGSEYGKRKWSVMIPEAGVGVQLHDGIGTSIDKISKIDFTAIQNVNSGNIGTQINNINLLIADLTDLNNHQNAAAETVQNAAIGFQIGHFGLGVHIFSDLGAIPHVDLAHLGTDPTQSNYIGNNQSSLNFRGIATGEVPLTYGYAINPDFAIGGNVKYITGRTYHASASVFNQSLNNQFSNLTNTYQESSGFGVDLGLLYKLGNTLRVGLVGRNLNSPSYGMTPTAFDPASSIQDNMQVRTGIAFQPVRSLIIAADCDVTKNKSIISDQYQSQNLGGGIELNLLRFLQLRAGAYTNLAYNDIGVVYTAGLGINLWLLNVDIGAAVGKQTDQYQGNSIPEEARVEIALNMLF
ncbi:MAG: conjugal transfer protein TraF [Nitrospiria bacterium]